MHAKVVGFKKAGSCTVCVMESIPGVNLPIGRQATPGYKCLTPMGSSHIMFRAKQALWGRNMLNLEYLPICGWKTLGKFNMIT